MAGHFQQYMLVTDATDSAASDDCVVVHVKMPPEELVKKAVSLQLPPTFYNYLALPECPGCIGCRSSSESSNVEVPSTDAGAYARYDEHVLFLVVVSSCRDLVYQSLSASCYFLSASLYVSKRGAY